MSHFFGCSFKQPTDDESTDQRSPPCGHVIIPLSALPCNDHVPECPLKTENDQNPSAAPPLPSEVSRDTNRPSECRLPSVHAAKLPRYTCGPARLILSCIVGIFALDCILRTLLKGVCPSHGRAVAVDSFLLVEVISGGSASCNFGRRRPR